MIELSAKSRPALRRALGLVAVPLLLLGCGDDGLGQRYKVSGNVTYQDKPVAAGNISFFPAGGSAEQRGATGVIKDGYYTLSTQGDDDGAFPGDYLVAITARTPDLTEAKKTGDKIGGLMPQEDVAKAYKKAPSAIPQKYESPEKGGLKAKVEAKSNTIDFTLAD